MTHTKLATILALPAAEREQAIEQHRKAIEAVLAKVAGVAPVWPWAPLTDPAQAAMVTEKMCQDLWTVQIESWWSKESASGVGYSVEVFCHSRGRFRAEHFHRATAEALAGALAVLKSESEGE